MDDIFLSLYMKGHVVWDACAVVSASEQSGSPNAYGRDGTCLTLKTVRYSQGEALPSREYLTAYSPPETHFPRDPQDVKSQVSRDLFDHIFMTPGPV